MVAREPRCIVIDQLLGPGPNERGRSAEARARLFAQLDTCVRTTPIQWIIADTEESTRLTGVADSGLTRAWQQLHHARTGDRGRITWASVDVAQEDVRWREIPARSEGACGQPERRTLLGAYEDLDVARDHHQGSRRPVPLRCSTELRLSSDLCPGEPGRGGRGLASSEGNVLRHWTLEPSTGEWSDMTVVIGGVHDAGRDMYWTPWGRRAGVEIWAEAIDDLHRNQRDFELMTWAEMLANILFGVVFGCIALLVRGFWWRLVAAALLVTVLVLGSSLTYFLTGVFYNTGILCLVMWLEVLRLTTTRLEERLDPAHRA